MIKNTAAWIKAYSRFGGFQLHTPMWPHQKHVEEYHSIIADFEKATDADFTDFKIKDTEMDHPPHEYGYLEPVIAGYKYCDPIIFKTRVAGLVRYLVAIVEIHTGRPTQSFPKKTPETRPQPPTTTVNIGAMHGSQFVTGSPNTSIRNSYNAQSREFTDLIHKIKDSIPELNLNATQTKKINSDVSTIEAQIESPAPNYTIIDESGSSIKAIINGIASNVLTNSLLIGLSQFFSK